MEAPDVVRFVLLTVGAGTLALLAAMELGLAYPAAWWLYLAVAALFAAALLRPLPVRPQAARVAALAAVTAVIAALYFVDWTSRKPFLRDLARVKIGMTEAEVRQIMAGYMEGTGWPAVPASAGSEHEAPVGQLAVPDSLVFRHSNQGRFNSDWGIVSFAEGRVAGIEFSPD